MGMIINPYRFGSGLVPTFQERKTDTSILTTYTFNNCAVGSGTRKILVVAHGATGASATLDSVTVDGNAATLVVDAHGANELVAIWRFDASGSVGASVTITLTYSAAIGGCDIGIMTLAGVATGAASDTAKDDDSTSSTDTADLTIDCPAGGVIIGAATARINGTPSYNWANLSTVAYNFDGVDGAGSGQPISLAYEKFAAAQTNLAVTCSTPGSIIRGIYGVAASFAPL